jgi:acetyl-CoA synthetase
MAANASDSVWMPTAQQVRETNIAALMLRRGIADYGEFHRWSARHREEFWAMVVRALRVRFVQPPRRILDQPCDPKSPRWLAGARMNIADSCFSPLTAHEKAAITWGGADGSMVTWSYADVKVLTDWVARGLQRLDVHRGQRIGMIMPMTPVSVAIYLGIIRAGGVVVSIADSFAAPQIAVRLQLAGTSLVFTQDLIHRAGKSLPLYERVCEAGAERIVVIAAGETFVTPARGELAVMLREHDIDGAEFMSDAGEFETVHCDPDDETNILFSSGTTGEPKAIPWTHTTPIKCAADAFFHHDVKPHDVLAWPTSLGWMMGPWLIYATLINGATMALYDDAPQTRGFAEFVAKAGVTMLGVVPSLVSHWRANGALDGLDLSSIRRYSSTGECSNPDDMRWLMTRTSRPRPIIEYCGGTEIGGGYITSTLVQPNSPSIFTTPALGLDFILLDETGRETDNGEVFLIPPSIGLSTRLMNRDHDEIYYACGRTKEGLPLRSHGDQIERLPGGCYRALGRTDDTMNLGGIKVSSAEIERVLAGVPGVRETAAVAIPPAGGGPDRLVIYAVLEDPGSDVRAVMQQAIREQLNPLFRIHEVVPVGSLPRTASNKVMRRELRARG